MIQRCNCLSRNASSLAAVHVVAGLVATARCHAGIFLVQRKASVLHRSNETDSCAKYCGHRNIAPSTWCWSLPHADCERSFLWMPDDGKTLKPCSWEHDACTTQIANWVYGCPDPATSCDGAQHVDTSAIARRAEASTEIAAFPPLCRNYFQEDCGLDQMPRSREEVQSAFEQCCSKLGHTASLCTATSREIFTIHGEGEVTPQLCQEFADVQRWGGSKVQSDMASLGAVPEVENINGELFSIDQLGIVELLRVPPRATEETVGLKVSVRIDKLRNSSYITGVALAGTWLQHQINISLDGRGVVTHLDSIRQPQLANVYFVVAQSPLGDITFNMTPNDTATLALGKARISVFVQNPPHDFFLNVQASFLSGLGEEIGGVLGNDRPEVREASRFLIRPKRPGRSSGRGSFALAALAAPCPPKTNSFRALRGELAAATQIVSRTQNTTERSQPQAQHLGDEALFRTTMEQAPMTRGPPQVHPRDEAKGVASQNASKAQAAATPQPLQAQALQGIHVQEDHQPKLKEDRAQASDWDQLEAWAYAHELDALERARANAMARLVETQTNLSRTLAWAEDARKQVAQAQTQVLASEFQVANVFRAKEIATHAQA